MISISRLLLCPFDKSPLFVECSIFSGATWYSRLILHFFSVPPLESAISLKSSNCFSFLFYFFSSRMVFRNQDLSTRCAHCSQVSLLPFQTHSVDRARVLCVSMCVCTHLNLHLFQYLSLCIKYHDFHW